MSGKATRSLSPGSTGWPVPTLHLRQIAAELERKGVSLQVLDQNIDTGDATGRLLFNMLGAIGQFETEIRAERQMDGIKKARARGVRFGRSKSLTEKQTAELRRKREQGTLIKTLMKDTVCRRRACIVISGKPVPLYR
jgi:DNA invertase Pin-like site-specific DNA recombinase